MNPIQAYKLICNKAGEKPVVMICREYENYFSFFLAAPGTNPNKPAFVGHDPYIVDKKSSRVYLPDDVNRPRLPARDWEGVDNKIFR